MGRQPLKKSRLLVANKHIGDLLYDKDAQGRSYLKFSPKNEVADFNIGSNVPSTLPVPIKLSNPIRVEFSYKFQDDYFSVKVIRKDRRPEYQFHRVERPPTNCLFYMRIKDWEALDDDDKTSVSPLTLQPPTDSSSIALVFSFLGANGEPIAPPEYQGGMHCLDLPEPCFNKFCIGIYPDPNNSSPDSFSVWFPTPIPI